MVDWEFSRVSRPTCNILSRRFLDSFWAVPSHYVQTWARAPPVFINGLF